MKHFAALFIRARPRICNHFESNGFYHYIFLSLSIIQPFMWCWNVVVGAVLVLLLMSLCVCVCAFFCRRKTFLEKHDRLECYIYRYSLYIVMACEYHSNIRCFDIEEIHILHWMFCFILRNFCIHCHQRCWSLSTTTMVPILQVACMLLAI